MLLEVIVLSVADARAAEAGGADRLEVVREIDRDGLTPALDLVRAIAAETRLPLRAMVRERADFEPGEPDQLAILRRAVADFSELRLDGVVLGFAREGKIDFDAIDAVLAEARGTAVTLHRAFDTVSDPIATIGSVRTRPQINRILTNGGPGDWARRSRRIEEYCQAAGRGLTILAGGGLDEAAVRQLARSGIIGEVHVGRAARVDNLSTAPVCADRVRRLREAAG
jgi:copper homeostasis protein